MSSDDVVAAAAAAPAESTTTTSTPKKTKTTTTPKTKKVTGPMTKYELARAIQEQSGKLQTPVRRVERYMRAVLHKRGPVAPPKKVKDEHGNETLKQLQIGISQEALLLVASAAEEALIAKIRAAEEFAIELSGDAQKAPRVLEKHVRLAALAAKSFGAPVY